jgi:glutathione synthase/RimK-type ligase-like ATP-grasp enzyme
MNGWLIYDEEGAKRNVWFIRRLEEEFALYGVDLRLKIVEDGFEGVLPKFAIVRTIAPEINAWLEERGVRVCNNVKTAKVACDKWETYLACKAWGIPVLPTERTCEALSFPLVAKSRRGHGGTEVFWVEKQTQAETFGADYVFQRPSEILGKDMRVYAIGGDIIASVMRTSAHGFKSNFSLGGMVELAQADETQKAIVRALYENLKFDFVGIDFLPTANGWALNEIEDAAGTRMLYSCSDIDIIPIYVKHVLRG